MGGERWGEHGMAAKAPAPGRPAARRPPTSAGVRACSHTPRACHTTASQPAPPLTRHFVQELVHPLLEAVGPLQHHVPLQQCQAGSPCRHAQLAQHLKADQCADGCHKLMAAPAAPAGHHRKLDVEGVGSAARGGSRQRLQRPQRQQPRFWGGWGGCTRSPLRPTAVLQALTAATFSSSGGRGSTTTEGISSIHASALPLQRGRQRRRRRQQGA